MKHDNITIESIKTALDSLDTTFASTWRKKFYWQLKMLMTVDQHYTHISELEEAIDGLKNWRSQYHTEYHPSLLPLIKLAAKLGENTRYNHYHKDIRLDVYDVLSSAILFPEYNITDVTTKRRY
jgi:hypothetical protein